MGNTNRYIAGMGLAVSAIVFGSFLLLNNGVKGRQIAEFDISYHMPRPKNAIYNFFFGLGDREIDRTEHNPFKNKKKDAKAEATAKNLPKIDPKKAQAKVTAPVPKPTPVNLYRKHQVSVDVVNSAPDSTLNGGDADPSNQMQNPGVHVQNILPAQSGHHGKKTETMSAGQWRALVVGQATKENVMKLVSAFNNKEVEASALYLIMNDLMQSANPETQNLGLLIGQSVPSLKSFSIVSENYEKLDANSKKAADAYLMTYMQGSKLSILALALQSEDSQVATRAAQVMVAGLEEVKKGQNQTPNDSRYESARGIVASRSEKIYAPFINILQDLSKSTDSTLAGLAQNALTHIQSLSNT